MTYENLVALDVADPASYQRYRDVMTPLLQGMGGDFRYDFEIARTLRSEAKHPINRLFAIRFPSRAVKERFFADPTYVQARKQFFTPAVRNLTIVAEYEY